MKNIEYELLSDLIKKSIADNEKENKELIDLLLNNRYGEELIDSLSSEDTFKENATMLDDAFTNIKTERLIERINKQKRNIRFRKISIIGASVAALFIISFYLFIPSSVNDITQYIVRSEEMKYKEPTLIIDELEIIKLSEGRSIAVTNLKGTEMQNKQTKQRIVVPSGKTHTVQLEDGTEVTLNACSELIYNCPFDSTERTVELKGEAYFKVVKDKKVFVVKSEELSIRVYGTQFNVKSNDKKIETILVEGSIGATVEGNREMMISPNEMLSYNKSNGNCSVKVVDTLSLLQWVDGCFKYVEEPLIDVLNDISKWYNVEFIVGDEVGNKKITLFSARDVEISDMLKLIEQSIDTKFIREGGDGYSVK